MSEISVFGEGLIMNYGETEALKGVDFSINKGEIFGFIGPDGAGKTSLFRILTTLLLPFSGHAFIEGYDVVKDYRQLRKILGYMPGKFSLYQDLTVEENLKFFAGIFKVDIEQNYHLISDIYDQIAPFRKRRAGKLSGGMKQKLALCCALIHKPEVLILDEPTTGVDAVSRREFWDMLLRLKQSGITILVATPYMDEALLCDRVALMQHGSIMAIDTPHAIITSYPQRLFRIVTKETLAELSRLRQVPGISSAEIFGQFIHVSMDTKFTNGGNFDEFLKKMAMDNIAFEEISPGIEDCFIYFMKQNENSIKSLYS
ncbi:MAG: ABC transporter ATP-binding protein [Lentimicrobium sp.]|jgi:ABC-type multidrug transport system ATPase subunit|nr:ABC transporter ATP-binding protein [Lentimicrobium sp.]